MPSQMVNEFRAALERGELMLQKCNDCSKLNMYPRYACPHCQSENLGWQRASGKGTLMSWTVLRVGAPEGFDKELPYALAVVKLEEGVQLLGRLLKDASGEYANYACDMKIAFAPGKRDPGAGARPAPWFGPAQ